MKHFSQWKVGDIKHYKVGWLVKLWAIFNVRPRYFVILDNQLVDYYDKL
jgi:hypothetical protein